jgi:hypothetical protein
MVKNTLGVYNKGIVKNNIIWYSNKYFSKCYLPSSYSSIVSLSEESIFE